MKSTHLSRICIVPRLSGVGGMVSFQHKLSDGLAKRDIRVCYDLADTPYDAVLVVGGTRHIAGLWQARRRGTPIIQRLDGMNWVHRIRTQEGARRTSLRHYLRAEYGNRLLSLIRSRFAQAIVYQSEFSRHWWERVHGATRVPNKVVYNGVDLSVYTPSGSRQRPEQCYRLLLVEGSLMGGYEMGLEIAMQLAGNLSEALGNAHSQRVFEVMVAGRVTPEVQRTWAQRLSDQARFTGVALNWAGLVPPERIPELDRSAHLLYSADVNAACPNSVIEALACGLPVVSFDTGALPELVHSGAGRIVPYGGDPWQLEQPDVPALAQAALEILQAQDSFRRGARARAEAAFALDQMVEGYLEVLGL